MTENSGDVIFKYKIPFPPSVNGLYGGGSGQQRFKTKRYKDWCKSVPYLPDIQIDFPVKILYTFTWPDNRERDGQNYIKAVTDTLVNAGVIKNDDWTIITSETWDFDCVDKKNSGVTIQIFKE